MAWFAPQPAGAAWDAGQGSAAYQRIEARWKVLSAAPARDRQALAELDQQASALAQAAADGLRAMREEAAERDADMAAVVRSPAWRDTEELIAKLRFRIATIKLERALASEGDRAALAKAAAAGFTVYVDSPDPELAAESRYGRGLARVAAGDRDGGLADLRSAAAYAPIAGRAKLGIAESLADGGKRGEALDAVTRLLAAGGLGPDLERRAELLRLRLLLEGARPGEKLPAATAADVGRLTSGLVRAGNPWRAAALGLLQGREDLIPAEAANDPTLIRLRAEAAVRRGDAAGAFAAYRQALDADPTHADTVLLDGLARAALAASAWDEALAAVARAEASGAPPTRERSMVALRAAAGAWRAVPSDATAAALAAAVERARKTPGLSSDEQAELAFDAAELDRSAGRLDAAIAALERIDAPAWKGAARLAALQCRTLRWARDPSREPRDALLRDLAAAREQKETPAANRATLEILEATVRTSHPAAGQRAAQGTVEEALDLREQRAALERLRDFERRYPASAALLPAALRAEALLCVATGQKPDPSALEALPAEQRGPVADAIGGDLRDEAARLAKAGPPSREAARVAVAGVAAFSDAAAAAGGGGAVGDQKRVDQEIELGELALEVGDPTLAVRLLRAAVAASPRSLRARRGLATALAASGDRPGAREAWQALAAQPDLPDALRAEAEQALRATP